MPTFRPVLRVCVQCAVAEIKKKKQELCVVHYQCVILEHKITHILGITYSSFFFTLKFFFSNLKIEDLELDFAIPYRFEQSSSIAL